MASSKLYIAVDAAVDTDAQALDVVRGFLGYLPSHNGEPPPLAQVPDGSDEPITHVLDLVPESRSKVYDARDVVKCVLDKNSMFELKARFGKSLVTTLGRLDGHTVGVIANNPTFKGGSIDADACAKATSFLVFCDSFNVPVIFLIDQPGFLIGIEGERRGAPGRIMNWMNALSLVSVPRVAITMRKNYGQAYLNMGGGRNADEAAAWPSADFGFMDPATGVNVLHGLQRDEDPERFARLMTEISQESAPWPLAGLFETQAIIDPRETRNYLKDILRIRARRPTNGVGAHRLSTWPTSY